MKSLQFGVCSASKVREDYSESVEIDILKKSQEKLKYFNTGVLIPLKAGRNSWCH